MTLTPESATWLQNVSGASSIEDVQQVQTLWSGYGQILRVKLKQPSWPDLASNTTACQATNVIVKQISPPGLNEPSGGHPRGWNTSQSHRRKLQSYEVESAFYAQHSSRCNEFCRVAKCFAQADLPSGQIMVLEDLDDAGFPVRHHSLDATGVNQGLQWLANFHATFLHSAKQADRNWADRDQADQWSELWPVGTYWHLATRPDELDAMPSGTLKDAASALDDRLNQSEFQTLVHGDAKVANMCFADDPNRFPAMVDFQYVGRSCGMKDVAYFLSSCMSESDCERNESRYLATYFEALHDAMSTRGIDQVDFATLESSWRHLYPIAWADFVRFLEGWCPGHAKLTGYSRRMVEIAMDHLNDKHDRSASD
ncbi:oxidoreductase family protein [Rhodopirellula bahusiensis]|uniref:Choline kinase n=1 Tax=Rhodopirellula bahusiensis TaxID=2014065 RepID=A0A2G1W3S7_9BACT|nr:oxidoreductase family protein [Rhodopirellula bahusiensis]PHQ33688.1 choline kinase [Rhodopirellula bahusiensis]